MGMKLFAMNSANASDSIQPLDVAVYKVPGYASSDVHPLHTCLPLKIINGGPLPAAALLATKTVVFILPADDVVLVEGYPFKLTTLVFLRVAAVAGFINIINSL